MIPIASKDIMAAIARHHLELGQLYQELAARDGGGDVLHDPGADDRVLSLREAAVRLGVTRSWLCRRENWSRVGGYRGADRRVHFPLSALAEYANVRKQ